MPLMTLEHSPAAYRADFALYGAACLTLAGLILWRHPPNSGVALALWVLAGGAGWTLAEYLLHRFVLHGMRPFKDWHLEHHSRPTALIGSPTLLSATLFASLVGAPAWWLLGAWPAAALSLGMLSGYLVYGLVHHATHHAAASGGSKPSSQSEWLMRRRRWHALHHAKRAAGAPASHFGVSIGLWDALFGTGRAPRGQRPVR